jgi:ketosteroid isomerase-like protein
MKTKLPQAITNYLQASNAHSPDGVVGAFTDDALVIDENREYRGSAAIRAWSEAALSKYKPHAELTDATEAGDKIVVTAKVSGTFPGSPVQLRFVFTLEGDKIGALLIEA